MANHKATKKDVRQDKLVKRGVIHKNKASNLKSKLSKVVKSAVAI
jgi:ribosomal protein S20